MRWCLLMLFVCAGCGQEPSNPVADALLEGLRDSPCTVNELKELYRPGLSLVISRSLKRGKPEYSQQFVVDTNEEGFRYEDHKLASPAEAVSAKTGKRLTMRTWAKELENIQCKGVPTTGSVTVPAGTFECLEYRYEKEVRGIAMRFRVCFAVKHPGLRLLHEATMSIGVVRTELVQLRVP